MRLGLLLAGLGQAEPRGDDTCEVSGLARDSRAVAPGDLFVCIRGAHFDGHGHAAEAVARGAVALVVEEWLPLPDGVPQVRVADSRQALADLSNAFYRYPSHDLRLIGVTGTNGKTTTTYLIDAILREAGHTTGLFGTVEYRLGNMSVPAERTTPEALELQRMLRQVADLGGRYATMEVSSHALALDRVRGCRFSAAVFTNLTHDHMDFHKDREGYREAKLTLFRALRSDAHPGYAAVNVDDPVGREILGWRQVEAYAYGLGEEAAVRAADIDLYGHGSRFRLLAGADSVPVEMALPGLCNVYNALAAATIGWREGVSLDLIAAALGGVTGVPGRWETLDTGLGFSVLIDFAHNPDALRQVLETARRLGPGPLIAVFGAEGRKEPSKRPLMGKVVGELADYPIITSDNLYDEDPWEIARQVEDGLLDAGRRRGDYAIIPDRREAIRTALERAVPGSVVVIAGKGHEDVWVVGDQYIPFNDRRVAEDLLQGLRARLAPRP